MTVLNQLIAELLEDAPKAKQYTEDDKLLILTNKLSKLLRAFEDLSDDVTGLTRRTSLNGYQSQTNDVILSRNKLALIIWELTDDNLIEAENKKLNTLHKQVVVNSLKKSINAAIEEAIN